MSAELTELMALVAGTAARRRASRRRLQELLHALEWRLVADALARMRLLATLGPRLIELAGPSADRRFELRVADALATGRRQGALLQIVGQRAIDSLASAGIRTSMLKGPALSEALYGDPARRSASDIDLLVEPSALGNAVEVVRRLGYDAPRDRVDEHGRPLLHFALTHERRELPAIELHWRIHWYESFFASERLLPPASGIGGAWRPAPVDELASLLLFYARDGFLALRHACDIGTWWDTRGRELEASELDDLIAAYPALGPVLRTALAVAGDAVGMPTGLIAVRGSRLRPRERAARRLTRARGQRSEAQQYAQMGVIDGLLAPPGGLREFARRQLEPQRAAGELSHAGRREGAYARRRAVACHAARVLSRYVLALLGLLHPRPQRSLPHAIQLDGT